MSSSLTTGAVELADMVAAEAVAVARERKARVLVSKVRVVMG
jgi:hypothetical protein